jgi:hypothetical protein
MPDGIEVTHDPEIPVRLVQLSLCHLCLDGAGGQCHVPGCALWFKSAPDVSIRDWVTVIEPGTEAARPAVLTERAEKAERAAADTEGLNTLLVEMCDDIEHVVDGKADYIDRDMLDDYRERAAALLGQSKLFDILADRPETPVPVTEAG